MIAMIDGALRVRIDDRVETDLWDARLRDVGGGFFHSPLALPAALPPGRAQYAQVLSAAGEPVALAVGVAQRCRLLGGADHVRLASTPAVADGYDPVAVLRAVADEFRRRGAAELSVASFDGGSVRVEGTSQGSRRREYVVSYSDAESALAAMSTTHRRHVRRGERESWSFGTAAGTEAAASLHAVQTSASERLAQRGGGFNTGRLADATVAALGERAAAGLAVFVAHADAGLLAAALVGWAGERAFYLRGGSTPAGYAANVSAWFHWRIMQRLAEAGVRHYNLGGTPYEAADSGHEQHGLHRFKSSFGGRELECAGLGWRFKPVHLRAHALIHALRAS